MPTETKKKTAFLARFLGDQSGATAVEYALIAAIVFLGIVTGVSSLRAPLVESFEAVASHFEAILSG